MIETGTIIATEGETARVRVNPAAGCANCASKSHCAMDSGGHRLVTVRNGIGAQVGDKVEFTAKSGKVLLSAAIVWLFPIGAMIAGYIVGEIVIGGAWSIMSAFVFLLLAGLSLRLFDLLLARGSSFFPEITRVLSR